MGTFFGFCLRIGLGILVWFDVMLVCGCFDYLPISGGFGDSGFGRFCAVCGVFGGVV